MCSGYGKARQHGYGVTRVWQAGHPSALFVILGLEIEFRKADQISSHGLLLSPCAASLVQLKTRSDIGFWQLLMLLKLAHI